MIISRWLINRWQSSREALHTKCGPALSPRVNQVYDDDGGDDSDDYGDDEGGDDSDEGGDDDDVQVVSSLERWRRTSAGGRPLKNQSNRFAIKAMMKILIWFWFGILVHQIWWSCWWQWFCWWWWRWRGWWRYLHRWRLAHGAHWGRAMRWDKHFWNFSNKYFSDGNFSNKHLFDWNISNKLFRDWNTIGFKHWIQLNWSEIFKFSAKLFSDLI